MEVHPLADGVCAMSDDWRKRARENLGSLCFGLSHQEDIVVQVLVDLPKLTQAEWEEKSKQLSAHVVGLSVAFDQLCKVESR